MLQYLIRRLVITLPVLFGVVTLSFLLIHLIPGDPVEIMLGEKASAKDKDALRMELGLDQPLSQQYAKYLRNLVRGDLGVSLQTKRPVTQEFALRIPATVELTLFAMTFAILIGVPLGVLAAIRKYSWVDNLASTVGLLGMSTPGFFLGPLLILVFAIHLDIFPVSDRGTVAHVILPALSLGLALSAILMRVTRANMLEVMREDYIRTAHAKGLAPLLVYFRHGLRNALIPIITVLGIQFGALLTGTVVTETIFDWPGLGSLMLQAIQNRNYPVVQACVLLFATTYVLVNLITDLVYSWAHPKMRVL